jgi:hypothetical protein
MTVRHEIIVSEALSGEPDASGRYGRYLHTIPEHVRHPDLPPGSHGYFVPPNELIPISRDEGHLFTEPNYGADIETLRDVLVNEEKRAAAPPTPTPSPTPRRRREK